MFREMQAQQTAFTGLAAAYSVAASVAYNNNASTGSAYLVSGNYFQVLGVGASMGRVFHANTSLPLGALKVASPPLAACVRIVQAGRRKRLRERPCPPRTKITARS